MKLFQFYKKLTFKPVFGINGLIYFEPEGTQISLPFSKGIGYLLNKLVKEDLPIHLLPENGNSMKGAGLEYKNKNFITHTTLNHKYSAVRVLNRIQKLILTFLLILGVWGLIINWHSTLVVIIGLLMLLYFLDLFFNLTIIFRSFLIDPEITISNNQVKKAKNEQLPSISVLCPLYKEEAILPQFVKAMSSLDYPKKKLQVLLLLEEDDQGTIKVAKDLNLPPFIQVLLVPPSFPRTKPKALNYGLAHSTGKYLVIYDAEDIPEKDQLKKAIFIIPAKTF